MIFLSSDFLRRPQKLRKSPTWFDVTKYVISKKVGDLFIFSGLHTVSELKNIGH